MSPTAEVVTIVPCGVVLGKRALRASVTYSVYNEICSAGQTGTYRSVGAGMESPLRTGRLVSRTKDSISLSRR